MTASDDQGTRRVADVIRDLYAVAAYYVANPTHPLPDSIVMYHHTDLSEVQRVAAEHGGNVYGSRPQMDHQMPGTTVPVTFLVSVPPTGESR